MASNGTDRCPECGGETIEVGGTYLTDYISCLECDFFERRKRRSESENDTDTNQEGDR